MGHVLQTLSCDLAHGWGTDLHQEDQAHESAKFNQLTTCLRDKGIDRTGRHVEPEICHSPRRPWYFVQLGGLVFNCLTA
eukprot:4323202-Amphidinium_carterae.1